MYQRNWWCNYVLTDADWSGTPPALRIEVFTSSVTYDALNRPIRQTDPGSNVHEFTYDKGGLLKSVKLNTNNYVNDIHYNSKGQRSAIWYGNGTKTSYTYDANTFRLRRLLTVNVDTLSAHYNEILQDLHYWYDPVGNITEIQDDAQQTLFYNNSVVAPTQKFIYDALYRLIEAKGRELIGTASFGAEDNYNDAVWQTTHKGDGNAVQNYTQHYTYDEVGNILELQHVATTGSYTRTYDIDTASNRLLETVVGMTTYEYDYDARGNMVEMPHLSSMVWNIDNELSSIVKGSEPTHYQYSNGQRVRKFTDKGSIKEERIYLGNYEIYRKFDNTSSLVLERTTVHISDDTGRIAMLEERTIGTDPSPATLQRYIYSNHLQSASLELDEFGEVISYEEYHPYGTTAYQANNASINAVAKRYRYTGKERDEESGLYYHGARYYIPWLCRWSAVDVKQSEMHTWSSYNYGFCNPIKWKDTTGMQPEKEEKGKKQIQYTTTSGETYNVDANFHPSYRMDEMKVLDELQYRWREQGQTVYEYYDEIQERSFSVLSNTKFDGETDYYSLVNVSTGEPAIFSNAVLNSEDFKWLRFDEPNISLDDLKDKYTFTLNELVISAPKISKQEVNSITERLNETSTDRSVYGIFNTYAAGAADFVQDAHDEILDLKLTQKGIKNVSRINATLGVAGRFLGVTSAIEHGSKGWDAYKKGNYVNAVLNGGKVILDVVFGFGKASNPFILFGGIAYTIWDMSGTMQW